jgi:hypothetical protein
MGWSLSVLRERGPELLAALFQSAGRALHLANAFEAKCTYVLRIANMVELAEGDPVLTLQELIANLPADKMLGPTLKDLAAHQPLLPQAEAEVLSKAREARNFIAHEGVSLGPAWSADSERILKQATRLRTAVTDLAAGDNIVSTWVCAIEEPHERIPMEFAESYPGMVDRWVFGHFGDLLDDAQAA